MRPLLSLVCLAAALVSAFAADDPWIKPPDGYAWPDDAATQPEKDSELQLSDVPAAVRTYLVDQYLPQKPPATVYVRRADLNGEKWLRIECSSRAGGGHFTRYLLQYSSGEYQTVRNEDHDMIHETVTIRKIEKP
jgi:hypothetical protein